MLLALVAAPFRPTAEITQTPDREGEVALELIAAVVEAIPNPDLGWEDWNTVLMAIYAASGGSEDGFAIADDFSRKSTSKYTKAGTEEKWQKLHTSPPNRIGYGSLVYWADDATWIAANGKLRDQKDEAEPTAKSKGNGQGNSNEQATFTAKADDWPVLKPEAMHGLAGEVLQAIEPHTESDPVALLLQYLVSFGSVVGRHPFYFIEAAEHYPNLYTLLAGATAKSRKGTSAQHIRRIMEIADPDWASNNVASGISSGEGIIHAICDQVTRINKKGVVEIVVQGVVDKRLLLDEREFSSALDSMQREGNVVSRVIREAWDCPRILRTLTKHSPTKATEPFISIIGHITVEELRRKLDQVEMANGFGNRFLFACVKRSKRLPHGGNVDPAVLNQLGNATRTAITAAQTHGRMTMTSTAYELWKPIYDEVSRDQIGLLDYLTARAAPQTLRLSLLYALLDKVEQIDTVHLNAALALWTYCEQSAKHIFGDLLGEPVADTILRALRQAGAAGLTRTAIYNLFGANRSSSKVIAPALQKLVTAGKAKCHSERRGFGPPTEIWQAI
jgi:hypothetical protein